MERRMLNCMFYKPTARDPLVNRVVAHFNGPFSHVELSFEDGTASSVMHGETVFFHNKNYSNPNYTVVTLAVSAAAYDRVQAFCRAAAQRKVGFCKASMFLSALPVQLMPARADATFCSRLVTEALQAGGVDLVTHFNPMLVTPTMLHDAVARDETKVLGTVPGRLRLPWAV